MSTVRTRRVDGVFLTEVEIEIDWEDRSLTDVVLQLTAASQQVMDGRVVVSGWQDRERDQEEFYLTVVGERPATEQEITAYETEEAKRIQAEEQRARNDAERAAEAKRQGDVAALRRARRVFPELFKEKSSDIDVRMIPIEKLHWNPTYHKGPNDAFVAAVLDRIGFDPTLVSALRVTDDGDGLFTIVDGVQRWEMARQTRGVEALPCAVLAVKPDLRTQANLYHDLNSPPLT